MEDFFSFNCRQNVSSTVMPTPHRCGLLACNHHLASLNSSSRQVLNQNFSNNDYPTKAGTPEAGALEGILSVVCGVVSFRRADALGLLFLCAKENQRPGH